MQTIQRTLRKDREKLVKTQYLRKYTVQSDKIIQVYYYNAYLSYRFVLLDFSLKMKG